MEEKTLKRWEDFEQIASEMLEERNLRERIRHGPIFRGQSNSNWKLASTLERNTADLSIDKYLGTIKSVSKEVASCTGKSWDIDDIKPDNLIQEGLPNIKAFEYIAYLRHNGFPSPLLDWTLSPYVAAYFAFSKWHNDINPEMKVSIYSYTVESLNKYGFICSTEPYIIPIGHTIQTDRKHYLQQSEYTICLRKERNGIDRIEFCRYEDVKPENYSADLVKYNIPASVGVKVLRKLASMNITAYSLFETEAALMETLSLREFFLSDG